MSNQDVLIYADVIKLYCVHDHPHCMLRCLSIYY